MDTTNTLNKSEVENKLDQLMVKNDPETIRRRGFAFIEEYKGGDIPEEKNKDLIKCMSINEFQTGALLNISVSDLYSTFAIDLMRKIEIEYNCSTVSEQATAQLIATSYARILHLQKSLLGFLDKDSYGDITVKIIAVLGKELDRANRQYLTSLQVLRNLKMPPMQLNIRADTAIVGQNQIVQNNEPK